MTAMPRLSGLCSRQVVSGLLFGQGISVLVAGTGVFSQYLSDRDVRDAGASSLAMARHGFHDACVSAPLCQVYAPTTQSLLNYVLLVSHLVYLAFKRRGLWKLQVCAPPFVPHTAACLHTSLVV
mgnify:CR=1 FL=1